MCLFDSPKVPKPQVSTPLPPPTKTAEEVKSPFGKDKKTRKGRKDLVVPRNAAIKPPAGGSGLQIQT